MPPFIVRCAALALAALAASASCAAEYPDKPIAVVVSGPAGGPLDVVTRTVFNKVSDSFAKQSVIIENRAGAGGILAVSSVTRAAPDGYTLLSTIDAPIVATPSLVKSVPYDPLKDLIPVAMLGDGGDNVLVVPESSPAKNVAELVALLRASPAQANYSSSGNGGPGHLLGELFNRQAGTAALHIPHKGAPEALNALLTARVAFGFIPVGLALPQINAGKLRPLAIAATERNPLLPTLPTVAEAGVKGFNPAHWWIIAFAPANTPADVVKKLNEAVRSAVQSPDVIEVLRKQALRPSQDSPEKLAERVRTDVAYWSRVIKELGITID